MLEHGVCKFVFLFQNSFLFYQAPGSKKKPDLSKMKLKNVDKNIAETILNEILDTGPTVTFKDIGECR